MDLLKLSFFRSLDVRVLDIEATFSDYTAWPELSDGRTDSPSLHPLPPMTPAPLQEGSKGLADRFHASLVASGMTPEENVLFPKFQRQDVSVQGLVLERRLPHPGGGLCLPGQEGAVAGGQAERPG